MKKIRVLTLAIVIFLLSACGGTPPAPTSAPTMTLIPIIMPTQTDAQIETYHYSTEVAPGVSYGPPALSESVFLEGAGGSGRDGLKAQTGMTEEDLVKYERAAMQGVVQSGYSEDQIQIDYLYDEVHLSWNMVLRLTSGNYLWSQRISDGAFSTFPLQIPYDEISKSIQGDTNYQLVEVQDSSESIAFYTNEGAVMLIGGPKVTIDGETYYSQWFNTNTGAWEDIPEVKNALLASLPDYFPGAAETPDQIPNLGSTDQLIELAYYFATQPPVVTDTALPGFGLLDRFDSTVIAFYCNAPGYTNCATLASARVGDHYYVIMQMATAVGPRNLLLYLGSPDIATEKLDAQLYLARLTIGAEYEVDVFLREKVLDIPNPEIYKWVSGPTDTLPDGSVQLENRVITDNQQTTIMYARILP